MTISSTPDTLLGVTDAARTLSLSETRIRVLADTGRLTCLKTQNGRRLFSLRTLERYQRRRAAKAKANNNVAA
jgi:DNA-binding transcriptional MerR regulator